MTVARLQQAVVDEYGEDAEVVLSCKNRYEINKKLSLGEDHRGRTWRTPVLSEWRCPQCQGADGLYFLVLEEIIPVANRTEPKGEK